MERVEARPTLVFDLDGTLVRCLEYYRSASADFAEHAATRSGCASEVVLDIAQQLDVIAARNSPHFTKFRYPTSLAAASLLADVIMGNPPNWQAAQHAEARGHTVYDEPYPAYEGIKEVLEQYAAGGWQLVLLTKGDDTIQLRKVRINQLERWFPAEQIVVTRRKDAANLRHVLGHYRADHSRTWVIGDSLRDDIRPAVELGVGAVHITGSDHWAYDRDNVWPTATLARTVELPDIIPVDARKGAVPPVTTVGAEGVGIVVT